MSDSSVGLDIMTRRAARDRPAAPLPNLRLVAPTDEVEAAADGPLFCPVCVSKCSEREVTELGLLSPGQVLPKSGPPWYHEHSPHTISLDLLDHSGQETERRKNITGVKR